MAARKFTSLLAMTLHLCLCQMNQKELPEFLAPLENHTIIQGRDVFFTCVVNRLQGYKVAWIKSDTKAILAVHTIKVAYNPRMSVTHNGHNTWKLHISNVQKNDSGTYMCQINTDPMLSQTGYMTVEIPPDILDDESPTSLVTLEGGNVRLKCVAVGFPEPRVVWKREDGRKIILKDKNSRQEVTECVGEVLELIGVQRQQMGSYLCIASNNVPPAISKRYTVDIHFPPVIRVTNQLVAAPINSNVLLQCYVEASPRAMNTWFRESGQKLLPGSKYGMSGHDLNDYSWQMNLTINSLTEADFGSYVCSAVNALGKAEGVVRLQELQLPTRTTTDTFTKHIESRPRKKLPKGKKTNHNKGRLVQSSSEESDSNRALKNEILDATQVMTGSTSILNQQTERTSVLPSISPPWIVVNKAEPIICCSFFLLSQLLITLVI